MLLLVMDTTRGDRCGVNGYARPTTPRLDAIAREGVTFRNAWSPAPWTVPAHAALFTGLRPTTLGMPTILELAGVPVPAGLDARSLLADLGGRVGRAAFGPALSYVGPMREQFPDADLAPMREGIESVTDGRHHFLRWSDGRVALYDVQADPGETDDLAATRADVVARLSALLVHE